MIGASYFFFFSLFGLIILFSLKLLEVKRGLMFFRVIRYKLDVVARAYAGKMVSYLRYINWTTMKLLLVFFLQQLVVFLVKVWKYIDRSTPMTRLKANLGFIPNEREGGVSPFVQEITPKIEKREDSTIA
jgi:hypothetical protein